MWIISTQKLVLYSAQEKEQTNPELVEQTALLQFFSVLVSDAEIPARKHLVAKALKAILILDQATFEPCGRSEKIKIHTLKTNAL